MKIQPQLFSLHQLLKERLFRIPDYQRSYSWRSKERQDLFNDIQKVVATGDVHFMATIVGLRRRTTTILTNEFHDIEVVDGQQRLTTLVLTLKAVERALEKSDEAGKAVALELRQLLVKGDHMAPVLLQTNHDASQHCLRYLRQGTHDEPDRATRDADRCLLEAMVEAESFVSRWEASGKLLELVNVLKNKLSFIFHELESETAVYTVFEALNSRGLDVSWFDRLKSILMGIAFDATMGDKNDVIAELRRLWRDIYEVVGLERALCTETLKFAGTLWSGETLSRPLGEEESVATLRRLALESPDGVVKVSEWLLCVVRAVEGLHRDRRRGGVTRISQARLLATAILTRDDLAPQWERLLGLWERVSFRIYGIGGKDARTRVGDYVRLARRTVQDGLSAAEIEEELKQIGSGFPIDRVIDELRDTDCYNDWQELLRYFLYRYEEHLAAKAGQNFDNEQWARLWAVSASDSIEHIHPQSKGVHQPSDHEVFVHRLGNLMLLPPRLNSKLRDKSPEAKREEYVRTGLHQAADVAKRIPTWDRAAIVQREAELIDWAKQEWAD